MEFKRDPLPVLLLIVEESAKSYDASLIYNLSFSLLDQSFFFLIFFFPHPPILTVYITHFSVAFSFQQ